MRRSGGLGLSRRRDGVGGGGVDEVGERGKMEW